MPTFKTSKAKENILGRVRKELNKKSLNIPFPEAEKKQPENIYAEDFNIHGGKFLFCNDEQELLENISKLYDNRGWKKLLCAERSS